MKNLEFKFEVHSHTPNGLVKSRFTNEKHMKSFLRSQKKDGTKTEAFQITKTGLKKYK